MSTKHVVMVASENGALRGGKAGGLGDVVRDLPKALAKLGWKISVITPAYGFLHRENVSKFRSRISFPFGGRKEHGDFFEVTVESQAQNVRYFVFEHPSVSGNPIYVNDPPHEPFKTDALKYALFCSAVGQFLRTIHRPYLLHLHDWHASTLLLLRELHPEFTHLKGVKTAFTIHNLVIQGTRPMRNHSSSVESWFPELFVHPEWINQWKDPRYGEPCYCPMAIGIQYADKVNTVSPSYAKEILMPSTSLGFYAGEGLEVYLQKASGEDRLFGILNGSEYPDGRVPSRMCFKELCQLIVEDVHQWKKIDDNPFLDMICKRIESMRELQPAVILTSVGRIVEQKIQLFFERGSNSVSALDSILTILKERNGVFFFLGNGSRDYLTLLEGTSEKYENFIFLEGYSDQLAEALYGNGNLFLMPSSYEPCGISQMIAMRDGQPCVVHFVGGLKDTVIDSVNGFGFKGNTFQEKVDNFIRTVERAMRVYFNDKPKWNMITFEARRARFTWEASAKQYVEQMYS